MSRFNGWVLALLLGAYLSIVETGSHGGPLKSQVSESSRIFHSRSQSCTDFVPVSSLDDANRTLQKLDEHTAYSMSFANRLGNRVQLQGNVIAYATDHCCDVMISRGMLGGFSSQKYVNRGIACLSEKKQKTKCPHETSRYWYNLKYNLNEKSKGCIRRVLQHHFKINSTHALGRKCTSATYGALHIRSGDIVSGRYNETSGLYSPRTAHHAYWLFPSSYYLSVISSWKKRKLKYSKIYVFCETTGNPTCNLLASLQQVMPEIEMRVGGNLLDDLFLMLCADEIAFSHSSLQQFLSLSEKQHFKHIFVPQKVECKASSNDDIIQHSFKNLTINEQFMSAILPWKDSEYQRYLVNKDYDMEVCKPLVN